MAVRYYLDEKERLPLATAWAQGDPLALAVVASDALGHFEYYLGEMYQKLMDDLGKFNCAVGVLVGRYASKDKTCDEFIQAFEDEILNKLEKFVAT